MPPTLMSRDKKKNLKKDISWLNLNSKTCLHWVYNEIQDWFIFRKSVNVFQFKKKRLLKENINMFSEIDA